MPTFYLAVFDKYQLGVRYFSIEHTIFSNPENSSAYSFPNNEFDCHKHQRN